MTYEQILANFNHQMLAGENDRTPLLSKIYHCFANPDSAYHVIHIAGTNGKGSTGTLVANSLQAAGYRVGYFSSPALIDEREMIRINGQMITKSDFVQTYQSLVAKLPAENSPQDLTVFEWWVMIALQYFKTKSVDWAVIECGLGGQADATNIIGTPDLAVITHLGLDHTQILGPTLTDIARSASGIIKKGTHACLMSPFQKIGAQKLIAKRCAELSVPLIAAGQHVVVKQTGFSVDDGLMSLTVNGKHFDHLKLKTRLLGTYQVANITLAAEIYQELTREGVFLDPNAFKNAVSKTRIPGRLQLISKQPFTYIDAAHNPDGAKALIKSIDTYFADRQVVLVLGFLADKNWQKMTHMYAKIAQVVIATTPNNPKRALDAHDLASVIPGAKAVTDPQLALKQAQSIAKTGDIVIATGSFYLIKELLPKITTGRVQSHLDTRSSY